MIINASMKKDKFFKQYVEIINVLFSLSNREMDILAVLIDLDFHWGNSKFKNILDTSSRKYLMKETYANKSNLSRYISIFKAKSILVESEDGWTINKKIMPTTKDNKLVITFNINIVDKE